MGARPDDSLDFFGGDLGLSRKVTLTPVTASSDKLPPGRWLAQLVGDLTNRVWVRTAPFSQAAPVAAVADVPCTPMGAGGVVALELNVRPGFNDQISGISEAATVRLILTPLSRQAKV
jgi:hypothetical protein